jgi:hypothetical protein
MAHRPARGDVGDGARVAALQFDLQFADRPAARLPVGAGRGDLAAVQRQFHRAALRALQPPPAPDVGAVLRQQGPAARRQQRGQRVSRRRAAMQRRVGGWLPSRRQRQRDIVLAALDAMGRTALERLHPVPALLAHPQRQPGGREPAVGGVEVDRLQPQPLRRAARQLALDGGERRSGHLQLQLHFAHQKYDRTQPPRGR